MKKFKTVCLPINIPTGKYCWNINKGGCVHCEDINGIAICDLGFNINYNKKRRFIKKPKLCLNLKDL